MPETRSPRRLEDVSHLFLTKSESVTMLSRRRTEAVLWLASLHPSANRAHLAAGLAHAFASCGSHVSLAEICRGLPNIGYYFALEPGEYLAPALDRCALVSGAWGTGIRFSFAPSLSAFATAPAPAASACSPHVIIAAFDYPERSRGDLLLSALPAAAAALSENGSRALFPDAVVIAGGDGADAACVRRAAALVHEVAPQAVVHLVTNCIAAAPVEEEEEIVFRPDSLRASWARRTPPEESWFGDMAAHLSQIISQRRRKGVVHAANE